KQAGFTMIELVMVIVILGILAAFALPRFADLGADARASTVQAVYGSVRSASAIAHAAFLVKNNPDLDEVTFEGATVDIVNGYPAGTATGIVAALELNAADFDTDTSTVGTVIISPASAASATNCNVTYVAAADGEQPTITIDVDNCN